MSLKNGEYLQTGDVLYFVTELPKDTEVIAGDIFHKGENHIHRVRGDFAIHKKGDEMFLECKSECELFHEEHPSIMAPNGVYRKQIVMEYDHILEESRQVID